jgi:ABC-2 type transport system permease protein
MTGLILVGLVPFAGLGIVMGHRLTSDSIGPAMGGTTALFGCSAVSGSRSRAA